MTRPLSVRARFCFESRQGKCVRECVIFFFACNPKGLKNGVSRIPDSTDMMCGELRKGTTLETCVLHAVSGMETHRVACLSCFMSLFSPTSSSDAQTFGSFFFGPFPHR